MRLRIALLAIVALVAVSGLPSGAPAASAEIEIRSQAAQNQFPDGIRFSLFMASDVEITEVRLRFRILPGGVNASVTPSCTGGTSCNVLVGSTRDSYMVPGAEVVYSWELSDSSGAKVTTEEQMVTYDDTRFEWQELTEGNVTVHYYFGDDEAQRTVLRVARETIERFEKLERTTVDFPVKIWVYRTASEMAPAVASRRGAGPDDSVRTLGEVGADDTALVSRDTDFLNIVRHELTHVVTGAATKNHLAPLPTWINEGLSTYSQNDLLPSEASALDLAIRRNAVLPITSLGTAARGSAGDVSVFYAQSGSIIGFMIDVLGEERFGDFMEALAGDTVDGALMTVYGLDTLGLENAWRVAVGLPEVEGGTNANSGTEPRPTLVPFGSGQSSAPQSTPETGDAPETATAADVEDDDSSSNALPILLGVLVLFVLGAGAVYLRQTRG
ncbi:MAG TPA: peptidase MA family metallohydrolase [Dehalococcoidia bacterium]|nr:peptidase MA family metallohydrolase [Dehalococcoidia bacterium]